LSSIFKIVILWYWYNNRWIEYRTFTKLANPFIWPTWRKWC